MIIEPKPGDSPKAGHAFAFDERDRVLDEVGAGDALPRAPQSGQRPRRDRVPLRFQAPLALVLVVLLSAGSTMRTEAIERESGIALRIHTKQKSTGPESRPTD